MQETWVRSLGGEDPLEEGMATHSGTPEESPGQRSLRSREVNNRWTAFSVSGRQDHMQEARRKLKDV